MVAWIPKLPDDTRPDADPSLPVPQFWDGEQSLGKEVARSVGADGWVAWDIYLFYPAGARWDDHLPAPAVALAQVRGVVVATKGVLPAAGDATQLPARLRDAVDVVGDQDHFGELLARAADAFAHRASAATTISPLPPATR